MKVFRNIIAIDINNKCYLIKFWMLIFIISIFVLYTWHLPEMLVEYNNLPPFQTVILLRLSFICDDLRLPGSCYGSAVSKSGEPYEENKLFHSLGLFDSTASLNSISAHEERLRMAIQASCTPPFNDNLGLVYSVPDTSSGK
jgi:hypothetical protein